MRIQRNASRHHLTILAVAVGIMALAAGKASAQAQGVPFEKLEDEIDAANQAITQLQQQVTALQTQVTNLQTA